MRARRRRTRASRGPAAGHACSGRSADRERPTRWLPFPSCGNVDRVALEIVPSIDLRGGKVVRLKQGDYARQVNYDVDPLATARSFHDAGARWMHIVDLDGAKEG